MKRRYFALARNHPVKSLSQETPIVFEMSDLIQNYETGPQYSWGSPHTKAIAPASLLEPVSFG
jgi:hypothetical protein